MWVNNIDSVALVLFFLLPVLMFSVPPIFPSAHGVDISPYTQRQRRLDYTFINNKSAPIGYCHRIACILLASNAVHRWQRSQRYAKVANRQQLGHAMTTPTIVANTTADSSNPVRLFYKVNVYIYIYTVIRTIIVYHHNINVVFGMFEWKKMCANALNIFFIKFLSVVYQSPATDCFSTFPPYLPF